MKLLCGRLDLSFQVFSMVPCGELRGILVLPTAFGQLVFIFKLSNRPHRKISYFAIKKAVELSIFKHSTAF